MSYDYSIDLNSRRATITFDPDADMSDILEALNDLVNDERFGPGFGLLVDARALSFVPSSSEAREIALLSANDRRFTRNPAAVVVSEQIHYGIGAAIADVAGQDGLAIELFYDLEKALEWLRGRQSGALH